MNQHTVFRAEDLLPGEWKHFSAAGPVRVFNPGLVRDGAGWLLAYRVVGPDALRRIALCRLDAALRVVPGSPFALSDAVRFRARESAVPDQTTTWFADPRLYRFGGRVFVYWNSGWHEPQNAQFLQEIDARTLQPAGFPRELLLRGERRKLEKNWMLFATGDGRVHAVYSILPQRVLALSLAGDGDILCEESDSVDWSLENYPAGHGGLRGGAPPQWWEGAFWSFCHSVHDAADGYEYRPATYRFAGSAPFAPLAAPRAELPLPNPFGRERLHPHLNPAVSRVLYPCGAAREADGWLLSYGINDEHAAVAHVPDADVRGTLSTIVRSDSARQGEASGS